MAEFFKDQLDYIFFFYGLAFFLLAAVCLPLHRRKDRILPWKWLGLFGLLHGSCEWTDLAAISVGDFPAMNAARIGLNLLSFLALIEFARAGAIQTRGRAPGRWIYFPLLAVIGMGCYWGLTGLHIFVRYFAGLPGGLWTALVLLRASRSRNGAVCHLGKTGLAMSLYAVFAGAVVPPGPFFPAAWLNSEWVLANLGVPIQLLRGATAICIATCVWLNYWSSIERSKSTKSLEAGEITSAVGILACLTLALAGGWAFTNALGQYGYHHEETHYAAKLEQAQVMLRRLISTTDNLALCMSQSPYLIAFAGNGPTKDATSVNKTLDRYSQAIPESICYILDSTGTVLASSNRNEDASIIGKNYAFRPYFQVAMQGKPGRYMAVGATSRAPGYYASVPIRSSGGTITQVAVIKSEIADVRFFSKSETYSFLVDPYGVAFVASQDQLNFRMLWPSDANLAALEAEKRYPAINPSPLLRREVTTGETYELDGVTWAGFRTPAALDGWSFVLLESFQPVKLFRLIGIAVTLLVSIVLMGIFILRQKDFETLRFINQSRETLQDNLKFLETLLDTFPNPVFYLDMAGQYEGCNRLFAEKVIGLPKDRIVGRAIADFPKQMPKELLDQYRERSMQSAKNPDIRVSEYQALCANKDTREFLCFMAPYFHAIGEVAGLIGVMVDITDRKRSEEERRRLQDRLGHAQKMESLNIMAGSIAHNFNNILMGVLGYQSLAIEEMAPNAPARNFIEESQRSARRAAELSTVMLTCVGQLNTSLEPLNLSDLIRDEADNLQNSFAPNVKLTCQTQADLPAIKGDKTWMRYLLMQVASNAAEAIGPAPGRITLSTGTRHCDAAFLQKASPNDSLHEGIFAFVEITDTGCGMDKAILDKIFDPFFTTKFMGRGLGLPAVQGIVRAHHGFITVESEPDTGTSLRAYFPTDEKSRN